MSDNKAKIRNEISAMAVVICNGTVLATVESIYGKPVLSLPKGHVEHGETVLVTAIRECFEETDVQLHGQDAVKELPSYSYNFTTPDGVEICKTIVPILFVLKTLPTPCAKEKRILKAEFMPIEEFVRDCPYDNVRKILEQL